MAAPDPVASCVHSARVRSLYDSEAVLRRTAGVLRAIGASEGSELRPVVKQRSTSGPRYTTFASAKRHDDGTRH